LGSATFDVSACKSWVFIDVRASDAGFDFVDVYCEVTIELDSCLGVRFLRLRTPLLMVTLSLEFLFECLVAQSGWEVVVRDVSVYGMTNLFDGQASRLVSIQALASTTTEQEA
jgi:hypothetical protein